MSMLSTVVALILQGASSMYASFDLDGEDDALLIRRTSVLPSRSSDDALDTCSDTPVTALLCSVVFFTRARLTTTGFCIGRLESAALGMSGSSEASDSNASS